MAQSSRLTLKLVQKAHRTLFLEMSSGKLLKSTCSSSYSPSASQCSALVRRLDTLRVSNTERRYWAERMPCARTSVINDLHHAKNVSRPGSRHSILYEVARSDLPVLFFSALPNTSDSRHRQNAIRIGHLSRKWCCANDSSVQSRQRRKQPSSILVMAPAEVSITVGGMYGEALP